MENGKGQVRCSKHPQSYGNLFAGRDSFLIGKVQIVVIILLSERYHIVLWAPTHWDLLFELGYCRAFRFQSHYWKLHQGHKTKSSKEQEPPLSNMIKKVILSFLLAAAATNTGVDAQISSAVSAIGALVKHITGENSACNQVACWIGSTSPDCVRGAAEKTQFEIMKGRDGYMIESIGSSGGWVRYWRVQGAVMGRGQIDWGTCHNGAKYVVENCQIGGAVKCK
ncbi:hypothetical protein FI667_g17540, partial [Globisporangium splendens]